MNVGFVLGLVGDGLSFAGAAWLARNEFKRESEIKEEEQMVGLLRDLPGINFQSVDGRDLASRMDVRLSLLRAAGRRARTGFLLLFLGFLFQITSRIADHLL